MTGLLLLFVFALWVLVLLWIVRFITIKLPKQWWREAIRVLLFVVLLPAPLADEIMAKPQFEQLCRENSTIQVNRATAKGKTVYLYSLPEIQIQHTWVPISMHTWRFVDVKTGETVVSYNTLQASGGWLIHALGISEGDVPLVFNSYCAPENKPASKETFKEFGITYIEPPKK